MRHDTPWIVAIVSLSGIVVIGYAWIAYKWHRDEKLVHDPVTKRPLRLQRQIFFWCGICGYGATIIRMWWPAWRLFAFALATLVSYTVYYLWATRGMRTIYESLHEVEKLRDDVGQMKLESESRRFFLNAISHDLRSPLNAISLNTQLLDMQVPEHEAEAHETIKAIQENTSAADAMLTRLLDYARLSIDDNRYTQCSLQGVLASVLRRYHAQAEAKGIQLRMRAAPLVFRTDCTKLDRILGNLVENSLKFTNRGFVSLEASASRDEVSIVVRDSGIGISPENQEHLFREFFQVGNYERHREKGFGMGLAISRALARQLGGDIRLQESNDGGTVFALVISTSQVRAAS
jgi:signal transduction histidine kinase